MRIVLALTSAILLAACGNQSDEAQLEEAANQSDPAAAAVLENAAENGMDPQDALQEAGNAAAEADTNAAANSQ
jgi:hypothetical protein